MPDTPIQPRRRFQFRLTTWFVLVAIMALALSNPTFPVKEGYFQRDERPSHVGNFTLLDHKEQNGLYFVRWIEPSPHLKYAALVLAAFVGWKAVWLIAEHRCNRPATHE